MAPEFILPWNGPLEGACEEGSGPEEAFDEADLLRFLKRPIIPQDDFLLVGGPVRG